MVKYKAAGAALCGRSHDVARGRRAKAIESAKARAWYTMSRLYVRCWRASPAVVRRCVSVCREMATLEFLSNYRDIARFMQSVSAGVSVSHDAHVSPLHPV